MSLSDSQSEFSSKKFTKQNSQISQISQNSQNSLNQENKINEQLLEIRKLYPPLSDEYGYEENNATINKGTLTIKNELAFKRKKSSLFDEEESSNILSDDFLQNLISRPCPLNKSKIISVMSKFIQNTSLIKKIQKEFQSDKKLDINELSIMCAEILNYIDLKKGKVLFRIGDIGDRFYFILSGKICILKLKEIKNVQMSYYEYIDYCMYLLKQKETYIFNEVIKKNENILRISTEAEVKSIFKVLMLRKIKNSVIRQLIPNISSLTSFLEKFGCKLEDFDFQLDELEQIENNQLLKNKEREWNNYLFKKCKPAFSDLMLFEPYESKLDNEEKHPITCYIYEPFLFMGSGLFFGDFALDSEINKRNATIRAEEDTILGFLKSVDYINIFAPKRKLEKLKEINYLYTTYFFSNINSRVFEKNYFHLFSPREYIRNNILFIFGSNPKSLILLKEGKVSLELKSSIIDLHNLIKYLWENIFLSKWYKGLNNYQKKELIPTNVENKIKGYLNESLFITLKVYGEKFIEEMNKVKRYQISMLTGNEIIGLEEIYLKIPYIMKATVIDNKVYCYEIAVDHINRFLTDEKQIVYPFVKSSVNKIISLIERLQNFKINGINMAKANYEKDYNDFIKLNENENKLCSGDNYIKINEISNEKKNKRRRNDNINGDIEQSKTSVRNYNSRNRFKKNNIKKKLINNKTTNKRYKSPVRLISTNLMPVMEIIMSKQEKKTKKEFSSVDDKINPIQPLLPQESLLNEGNENIFNQNEYYELLKNYENDNNIINMLKDSIMDNNKNNISNSTSTDVMHTSSENNFNSSLVKRGKNKTINELKKELKKINVIEFDNNEILNLNKKNDSKKSFSYDFLNDNNDKIKNIKKHSLLKHQTKLGNFHLSYVPLNVLSPKGRLLQRSHSSLIINNNKNINNNLSNISIPRMHSNLKVINYLNVYSKKSNSKIEEEKEKNDENDEKINSIWYGIKTKGIKNINNVNINKELSKYIIKKENKQNKEKKDIYRKINNYNLMNNESLKKRLSSDVIKNFYQEIKKRGYSSFIPNKESNTIFNRKYRRKYGSNSSQNITPNININSNINSCILPIINDKSNININN